jgi:hypothetical protein
MRASSKNELWKFFSCLTVLLLILSAVLERQLQSFRGPDGSSHWPQEKGVVKWREHVVGEDFPIYYVAGKVALSHGDRTLYYGAADGGTLSFRNLLDTVPLQTEWERIAAASGFPETGRFMAPPFTALLAAPLTLLPPNPALLTWRVLSILLLTASLYLVRVLLGGNWRLSGLFIVGVAAAFSFFPLVETLYQGQVDALVLLVWVLGVYFVQTESAYSSAFCFALATMIKASPILVVGLFLLRRQWRWLAAYTLWMCLFLLIGVWQLGWQNHVFWYSRALPILSGGVPFFASKSLPSFVTELYLRRVPLELRGIPYIPDALRWLTRLLSLLLYGGTLYYYWRRCRSAKNLVYELMVLPLVILLASPESFRHHYLLAALPLLYLWVNSQTWVEDHLAVRLAALGVATLVIGTPFADYVITSVRNSAIDLLLTSFYPAATILLIWLATEVLSPDERFQALLPTLRPQKAA